MNKDLTVGSPGKSLIMFTIPLFISVMFQQMYNIADSVIAGKFAGEDALAAIGASYPITMIFMAVAVGCQIGCSVVISKHFGAGNMPMTKTCISTALISGTVLSAVLTVVGVLFSGVFMQWVQTPDNIFDDGCLYLMIYTGGFVFLFIYNVVTGIFNSLGDSKTPVYFLLLSSLLNIGLDFFTILGLGMGVGGPALATVISQGISAVLCLIYMIRHYPILHMKDEEWKPDGRMLGTLCSMGIPMGLQYSITAIGSVVLQTAVNSLGSMAVAAVSTGSKVSMFFCCPFDALGGTMATYAGQNVGAKKLDRVKEGLKAASLIGIVYSLIAFVILFFGGKYIALLFMDADQTEIIGRVAMFLIGNSMFYIPLTFVNVVRFTIQGMGFSTFAILAGVCEMAARSLVGFCLVPVFGFLPACFASPLAWIFADAFLIPAFFPCMKKLKVLFGETA